jgi:hypothetical protein
MQGSKRYLLAVLFFTSCVKYYYTKEGGERVHNIKAFKYNRLKYTALSKLPIDTNAIYILDSVYAPWPGNYGNFQHKFVRFFSTGQLLFIRYDSLITPELVNNKNAGTPGYFIIDGDKIKADKFEEINGGQTSEYYGRIQNNGNIIFY